jgi:hypothetical protein
VELSSPHSHLASDKQQNTAKPQLCDLGVNLGLLSLELKASGRGKDDNNYMTFRLKSGVCAAGQKREDLGGQDIGDTGEALEKVRSPRGAQHAEETGQKKQGRVSGGHLHALPHTRALRFRWWIALHPLSIFHLRYSVVALGGSPAPPWLERPITYLPR